jgi:hypothetical protein
VSLLFWARTVLGKHGIDATWSPNAIRVAVVACLPRSDDRKLFNGRADGCGTLEELIELAARTLDSFKHRQTPLRPPPMPPPTGEDGSTGERTDETSEEPRSPYVVK